MSLLDSITYSKLVEVYYRRRSMSLGGQCHLEVNVFFPRGGQCRLGEVNVREVNVEEVNVIAPLRASNFFSSVISLKSKIKQDWLRPVSRLLTPTKTLKYDPDKKV